MSAPVGLVLYGPPAVGKSSVAGALAEIDARFALCPVVKAGPGRTEGYVMVSRAEFADLARAGRFVVSWERYGAQYAVSVDVLDQIAAEGRVPVVQLGSVATVQAVTAAPAGRWTVVQLWASREVCEARARARGTGDVATRMAVYDQTVKLGDDMAHLTLNTGLMSVSDVAYAVRAAALDTPYDLRK